MRIKKFTTMMLAGMLALPTLVSAADADLEKRVKDLESKLANIDEKSEGWDLASRIQWSGDFRFRADYVKGDAPSHYTALDIGDGVAGVLDAGQNGMPKLLTAFGLTGASPLGNLMGGLPGTPAGFITTATGVGLTTRQATDLAAIFYNPTVGAAMGQMVMGGATIGDVASAFGSTQALVAFMQRFPAETRAAIFAGLYGKTSNGYKVQQPVSHNNDTIYTNRFRLNLRAKAMENLEFKARLAMYKVWGMQSNAVDYGYNAGMGGGPFMLSSMAIDGASSRQPKDSVLRVDRAYMNWNAIGGTPVWFSIGRRPVTDGPPANLRMGLEERMATPIAFMDYAFDGATLGYAYENLLGIPDAPGRVRFCYGRGFEAGPTPDNTGLNDVDFGGISWDVYDKGSRYFGFQSFGAFNMFNVPDGAEFVNPVEFGTYQIDPHAYDPTDPSKNLKYDRANLGNIYHTSTVYMSKVHDLNYFVTGGWSRTDAKGVDELGTSLLGSWWEEPQNHNGYSVLMGVRYDVKDLGLKVGAEYNWGSQYWISFTPGHDDLYASKLATRGNVYELYTVYDLPAGAAISKFSKAFVRLGYQHYNYKYTGSGFWLGRPEKVSDLANDPLKAQFYTPIEKMDQVYLTMEAWF